MSRGVLLLVNRDKPEVVAALDEVRTLIARRGRLIAELDALHAPLDPSLARGAELVVVLGGDGTLMSQSRRCLGLGLPMLGVNLGKLGFMAEFDLPDLHNQADSLFDGSPLLIQDRPLLSVRVGTTGGAPEPADPALRLALNDAVITAGPPFRMIAMSIHIDGVPGPRVMGDGLIVSTPIGTTAYNVSAGGPIVAPGVDAMVITPLAAHSLAFRPVVVPLTSTLEITLERVNETPSCDGTSLVLDGQVAAPLKTGQVVTIRQHSTSVRFVRNPRTSYWTTLISKMRWAAAPSAR